MNKTRRTFFRTASATGIGETIASVIAFKVEMGRSFGLWTAFRNQAQVEWLLSARLHWKGFREAATIGAHEITCTAPRRVRWLA